MVDIKLLKSAEDRANYLSEAAKQLCRSGEQTRSKKLFEESISEWFIAQKEAEKNQVKNSEEIIYGGFPRISIIQNLANCDSEMAWEFLNKTRPQKLTKVINDFNKDPDSILNYKRIRGIASWDMSRRYIRDRIARNNPDRALEFIKQDLETWVSNQTLTFLKILNKTSPALANELAERAIERLIQTPFYYRKNKQAIYYGNTYNFAIATQFLKAFAKEKPYEEYPVKVSDITLMKLADKISTEVLNNEILIVDETGLKIIHRFYPNRVARIEKLKTDRLNSPEFVESRRFSEFIKSNPHVEKILSNAKSFSSSDQQKLYKFAACKLVENEKFIDAENLLTEKYPEKNLIKMHLSLIIYSKVLNNLEDKKYEEAEIKIKQIPDSQLRIDAVSIWADEFYRNNKSKNKQKAISILSKAEAELNSNPDIYKEEALRDIIIAYALVDPEIAFPKFESFIDQQNQDKPIKRSSQLGEEIKEFGTVSFWGVNSNTFLYENLIVSRLETHNFDRIIEIINKLKQPKDRIIAKLSLFNGVSYYSSFTYNDVLNYCNP